MDTSVEILKKGGIGILPTDTLYGIVGSAMSKTAVERIYEVRKRDLGKPFIVLISSIEDLSLFGVKVDNVLRMTLEGHWPGPVSIILPVTDENFDYLTRGKQTLAFRFPKNEKLIEILKPAGPLVAPSANPQGQPPATTIAEAKKYFGESVDFYEEGGTLAGKPSKLIAFENGEIKVLR